jgi:Domain of unknown function (DUF4410)
MFAINRLFLPVVLISAGLLASCATDVAQPDAVVRPLAPEQKAALRVADVSAETHEGVTMPKFQIDRLVELVKSELAAQLQQSAAVSASPTVMVKMIITEYDEGNAFARFMLAGLGQIRLGADVIFVNATSGEELARYKVSKQFAFGGIYGVSTRMEDVEEGFAKSVVAILQDKKAELGFNKIG